MFEAGPCFGWCPDFRVSVSPNGAIAYEGRRFTSLQGAHALPADPRLYRALSDLIASPRLPWPRGHVEPGLSTCPTEATDHPSYALSVEGANRRGFRYYSGCRGPDAERADRIVRAVMEALAAHGVPTEGVRPAPRTAE